VIISLRAKSPAYFNPTIILSLCIVDCVLYGGEEDMSFCIGKVLRRFFGLIFNLGLYPKLKYTALSGR